MRYPLLRLVLKRVLYTASNVISFLLHPLIRLRNRFWPDGRVRVLVYHRVCEMPKEKWVEYHNVSPASFAAQMKLLAEQRFVVLTVGQILEHLQQGRAFPPKAVCITFDDGYRNNYTLAFPELLRYGLKASFYIVTNYVDSDRRFAWLKKDQLAELAELKDKQVWQPLRWSEIRKLSQSEMEIGSHTCSHPNFSTLGRAAMVLEIEKSKEELRVHIGRVANSFVCPFGLRGQTAEHLKAVFRATSCEGAFLGSVGAVGAGQDPLDMPRFTVHEKDSLAIFQRKIDGAFDWLAWFQPAWVRLFG